MGSVGNLSSEIVLFCVLGGCTYWFSSFQLSLYSNSEDVIVMKIEAILTVMKNGVKQSVPKWNDSHSTHSSIDFFAFRRLLPSFFPSKFRFLELQFSIHPL